MFYALSWFFVVALLAIWSLAAWTLHAVALWTASNAGALSGAASSVGNMVLPGWLASWVPPEVAQWASQLVAGLARVVDSMLQAAPALAGGLSVTTWVIWGIGSVLLVLLGAGLHLLIALLRRRGGGGTRPNAASPPPAG
ncbi:hypothetical protein [Variovorax sp. DT-64]|uniref:hypothetical protein n=1 Tax=Variovorax sp. DT-64 TaxID=3396160 RepID=UPI003F1D7D5E